MCSDAQKHLNPVNKSMYLVKKNAYFHNVFHKTGLFSNKWMTHMEKQIAQKLKNYLQIIIV